LGAYSSVQKKAPCVGVEGATAPWTSSHSGFSGKGCGCKATPGKVRSSLLGRSPSQATDLRSGMTRDHRHQMSQFGASTTITPRTKLIMLDCFETLIQLEGTVYQPRNGVSEFLTWFSDRQPTKLVVISDAELTLIEDALRQAGLSGFLPTIYHAGNALERLPGGRTRKRLDVPLKELDIGAVQAVFIGDSPLDAEAAAHYQVPFIRVPRHEDRAFSFISLIKGPSRYNSSEFSATFFEQYLKKPDG